MKDHVNKKASIKHYTVHLRSFEMRSLWLGLWFTWIVGFMEVNAEMLWLTMPREDERGVLGHCRGEGCEIRCRGYTRWTAAERNIKHVTAAWMPKWCHPMKVDMSDYHKCRIETLIDLLPWGLVSRTTLSHKWNFCCKGTYLNNFLPHKKMRLVWPSLDETTSSSLDQNKPQ